MIELYDLVGANNLRFSPFCWRTKAVMAYKKIPYTTVPIRFSDKDKLAFSGQDRVPVIKDNGKVVSDSWTIAEYLEDTYPDAKIFPGLGLKEACRFFNLYVDRTV
ncbi:MAG TPA: glutathione S-transferase N-terminal domain-containing protein, partial [Nitrospira sp.]|nr:glutathione S-transferase N-terminal domain-containing protein [Nitrospira sp.]